MIRNSNCNSKSKEKCTRTQIKRGGGERKTNARLVFVPFRFIQPLRSNLSPSKVTFSFSRCFLLNFALLHAMCVCVCVQVSGGIFHSTSSSSIFFFLEFKKKNI